MRCIICTATVSSTEIWSPKTSSFLRMASSNFVISASQGLCPPTLLCWRQSKAPRSTWRLSWCKNCLTITQSIYGHLESSSMSSLWEPRLFTQIASTRWFTLSSKILSSSLKICRQSSNRSCKDCLTRRQASGLPGLSYYRIHSSMKLNKRRKIARLGTSFTLTGRPTSTTLAANKTCRRCLKPTILRVPMRIRKLFLKS